MKNTDRKEQEKMLLKAGMCSVQKHNIADECPEFIKQADCVISSPPCNLTTLRKTYNEAGVKFPWTTYEPFVERFFKYIDTINPDVLYIQVYPSNRNAFIKECEKRFKFVCTDNSYYYRCKKNLCWIIRCGNEDEAPGPEKEIDAAAYIRWVCKNVDCRCIADPCSGTGIVGINANRYEKKFVGTELNGRKIEALINDVTAYEQKKAEKEKKKMMKAMKARRLNR